MTTGTKIMCGVCVGVSVIVMGMGAVVFVGLGLRAVKAQDNSKETTFVEVKSTTLPAVQVQPKAEPPYEAALFGTNLVKSYHDDKPTYNQYKGKRLLIFGHVNQVLNKEIKLDCDLGQGYLDPSWPHVCKMEFKDGSPPVHPGEWCCIEGTEHGGILGSLYFAKCRLIDNWTGDFYGATVILDWYRSELKAGRHPTTTPANLFK